MKAETNSDNDDTLFSRNSECRNYVMASVVIEKNKNRNFKQI